MGQSRIINNGIDGYERGNVTDGSSSLKKPRENIADLWQEEQKHIPGFPFKPTQRILPCPTGRYTDAHGRIPANKYKIYVQGLVEMIDFLHI